MFSINPLEILKVYISSRPPLVVFMISVSAVAIAFLTLGYFFKIKEIKSPEMSEVKYTRMDLLVHCMWADGTERKTLVSGSTNSLHNRGVVS